VERYVGRSGRVIGMRLSGASAPLKDTEKVGFGRTDSLRGEAATWQWLSSGAHRQIDRELPGGRSNCFLGQSRSCTNRDER